VNANNTSSAPNALTREHARLVQESFAVVAPIADEAAAIFYARLFEVDPSLRALFHGDMRDQGHRLMQALGLAIRNLEHLEWVVPAMKELGRRHAGYGVKPEHFGTVGAAFLWTLERGLGSAFTAEVRDAWTSVYGLLTAPMQEALAETARRNGA
jgi:hemoglobin-like flavoprotein